MKSFFIAVVMLCVASVANAQGGFKSFLKGDEYVAVAVADTVKDFNVLLFVADALYKAGYTLRDETKPLPPNVMATWCMVSIDTYVKDRVKCQCYSRDSDVLALVVQEPVVTAGNNYANIAPTLARLRDMHRRASAFLGIK